MPVRRAEPGPADAWLSAEAPLPLLRVIYGKQPLAASQCALQDPWLAARLPEREQP